LHGLGKRAGGLAADDAQAKLWPGRGALDESFAAMALDRSDLKTARTWAETGLSDGLEEDSSF